MRSSRGQKPGMPASRDQADQTRRVPLPPEEMGPVPVSLAHAEPRWFGVPPPLLLLGVAVLSFAIALALFATALGLMTAIPLVFSHVLFKAWITRFEVRMKGTWRGSAANSSRRSSTSPASRPSAAWDTGSET